VTLWLKGKVEEEKIDIYNLEKTTKEYKAGLLKYTSRANVHKIHCKSTAWALSFRGPWKERWIEYNEEQGVINLTHGRRVL
jgi:hypothetical protein